MNKTKEEIEKILLSFEREFDRCNGNYKYNRKPVINKFLVLVDTIRNETLDEVEREDIGFPFLLKMKKTNGNILLSVKEAYRQIINNLKTKNEKN